MAIKNVLITGASGFIGAALLHQIYSNEKSFHIITAGRKAPNVKNKNQLHLDIDLNKSNLQLPKNIDTILHMAGEKSNESTMWEINYYGTKKLLEAANNVKIKRFIYLSSVGVYGAGHNAHIIDTTYPKKPKNTYEKSKQAGEAVVYELCQEFSINCIVAQPSNVIGYIPNKAYPLLGLIRMIKKNMFSYFGDYDAISNYINVTDVASALIHICNSEIPKNTYIINTPCKLHNIVQWISEELDITPPSRKLPMFVGKALGMLGDLGENITKKTLPFNSARFHELSNKTLFDGTPISSTLKFNYPSGIELTIRQLVQTYRNQGLI